MKTATFLTVSAVVLAVLGADSSSGAEPSKAAEQPGKPVKIIATAPVSGSMGPGAGRIGGGSLKRVIRSQEELVKAIGDRRAKMTVKMLKVESIDFSKHMLIWVTAGVCRSGGYRVEITKALISDDGKKMTVQWTVHPPRGMATMALTHPGVLALVEKFDGQVEFTRAAAGRLRPGLPPGRGPIKIRPPIRPPVRDPVWPPNKPADDRVKRPGGAGSYVMVTKGIVGGFVPAHVRLQVIIVPQGDKHTIVVKKHADRRAKPTYLAGTLTKEQYADLFAELDKQGLWKLPTEQPPGSQDVYRRDTSISARQGAKSWRNGGPAGCVHGQSKVKPTKKQIEQFTAIVVAIKKLAGAHADDESDAATFFKAARLAGARVPPSRKPQLQ